MQTALTVKPFIFQWRILNFSVSNKKIKLLSAIIKKYSVTAFHALNFFEKRTKSSEKILLKRKNTSILRNCEKGN